jgi:hypothetical protein
MPDKYCLLNLQDLSNHLHGATIFSKLDLEKGHQVPIAEEDIPKTAVVTPFGLFEFFYRLFSLKMLSKPFYA